MFLSTPDYLWNNSETQKNLHFWKIFCDMVCDGGVGCDRAPVTSLIWPEVSKNMFGGRKRPLETFKNVAHTVDDDF